MWFERGLYFVRLHDWMIDDRVEGSGGVGREKEVKIVEWWGGVVEVVEVVEMPVQLRSHNLQHDQPAHYSPTSYRRRRHSLDILPALVLEEVEFAVELVVAVLE